MNGHETVIQPRRHFARKLVLVMAASTVIALCVISLLFYQFNARAMKNKLLDTIQLTDKQIVSQIENRFSQIKNASDTILYYMYAIPERMDTDPVNYLDSYALLRKNTSLLQSIFAFRHVIFFLEENTPFSQEGLMFFGMDKLGEFSLDPSTLKAVSQGPCWLYRPAQTYPFFVDMSSDPIPEILYLQGKYVAAQDRMQYLYYIGIDADEITDLLSSAYPAPSIASCLVSDDGTVISSSDASIFPRNTVLDPDWFQKMPSGSSFADKNAVYYCRELENGWHYITQVSQAYIHANTRVYISTVLLILTATILAVVLIIILITGSMTRRITLLSKSAGEVRFDQNQFHGVKADYVLQIPEKEYDEIDQLACTYNRMMDMIYDNIDHITALRQQEESLKYRLLQSLINPHFLYNILDSIAACNRIGKTDLANRMIMDLTKFYRMTMNKSNELITIRDELEIATLYLELEAICRGNSYSWEIHTEEDIENFLICKFTLQPFIENSIRHGMLGSGSKLHIQIDVRYGDDTIIILIRDNGHGIPADKLQDLRDQMEKGEVDTSKHFGICNVSARISSELFGHGCIQIDSEEGVGTTVKIEFLQLLP